MLDMIDQVNVYRENMLRDAENERLARSLIHRARSPHYTFNFEAPVNAMRALMRRSATPQGTIDLSCCASQCC